VITNNQGAIVSRHDYMPFGEEITSGTSVRSVQQGYVDDGVRQKFTGKDRDSETGLDYFIARYYSSIQGRFTSVDSGPFTPAAPQNWNRYAFVENNPLKFVDPKGRKLELSGPEAQNLVDYLKKRSGGLDLSLDKKGKVKIGKNSPETKNSGEKAFRGFLKKIIDATETVKLDVQRDAPNNFVDDTGTAAMQKRTPIVDMDDIEALDAASPALATALTAHFLYEGLRLAQGSPGFTGDPFKYGYKDMGAGAHINALALESQIMSAFTGQDEGEIAEHRDRDYETGGVLNFIYDTVQFDVTVKSTGRPNSIAVDEVKQTTPTRRPSWPPGP
jgi:RHS repeat-associated protein